MFSKRNRKHVLRVSIELYKHSWKFFYFLNKQGEDTSKKLTSSQKRLLRLSIFYLEDSYYLTFSGLVITLISRTVPIVSWLENRLFFRNSRQLRATSFPGPFSWPSLPGPHGMKSGNIYLWVDVTCDQASLIFFVAAGRYAWYNYLTICLLLVQNLDFSLIGQETKRYLELSHDWLPLWRCDFRLKKIPRADEFHHDVCWGERRERVFVSFKCFFSEFCSQNSQRRTNRMHS